VNLEKVQQADLSVPAATPDEQKQIDYIRAINLSGAAVCTMRPFRALTIERNRDDTQRGVWLNRNSKFSTMSEDELVTIFATC